MLAVASIPHHLVPSASNGFRSDDESLRANSGDTGQKRPGLGSLSMLLCEG